jgi:hypothetical protein
VKRSVLALLFGGFITVLPWILRPVFGDAIAILWLPGFVATSHWFPLGLHGNNAGAAKAVGCTANIVIWAGAFLMISVQLSRRLSRLADSSSE